MSLKGFHIVFISLCTLLFGFLIFWAFVLREVADAETLVMGLSGIAGLLLLPFYAVHFLKKARRLAL